MSILARYRGALNSVVALLGGGVNDLDFFSNIGTGAGSSIASIAVQSDGKILVGGSFSAFDGVTSGALARLNNDGTLDADFSANVGSGGSYQSEVTSGVYESRYSVTTVAPQPDGKILVGGNFTSFNGTTINRIVRLNSDGTRDTAFTTNIGTGTNFNPRTIAIQPDGKILVGGVFTTFNGATVNRIVRLNSDGTRDTAFTTNTGTGADSGVSSIAVQSDGKIILGGDFSTFNGTTANDIVRLNSNGTIDTAFLSNTGTGSNTYVRSIAIQSDGKILVGGAFTSFNGTTANRIVRLNSDGTRDTAFTTNNGTGIDQVGSFSIFSIAVQSGGKILLGGRFNSFDGTTANDIARLNSDGTLDTAFITNTGTGANNDVIEIAIQPDGKIVVGGYFTGFGGYPANRIARLGGA